MEEPRDEKGRTEEEFLEYYKTRNYEKPSLTADIVVITKSHPSILLIRRGGHPFLGKRALPGGFANKNEAIEDTARRELEEETGIKADDMKLVGIYSKPGRDPRGWVVSGAFLETTDEKEAKAGDDARDAAWFEIKEEDSKVTLSSSNEAIEIRFKEGKAEPCPDLAFDHNQIIIDALKAARLI
ncbi:MAG: NUDIX domain-containing protein [Sphaerochaetaceae bacterium]